MVNDCYSNVFQFTWYVKTHRWPRQVSDPNGSELRPRPALTVLWSLSALELLPRPGTGRPNVGPGAQGDRQTLGVYK